MCVCVCVCASVCACVLTIIIIVFPLIFYTHIILFAGPRVASLIALRIFRADGMRGAPCWLWNALAARAYESTGEWSHASLTTVTRKTSSIGGAIDYFYQTNDDIEFLTACWAEDFITALENSNVAPNFGLVGPLDSNNERILTQSFVHRTHLEVFGAGA